MHGGHGGNIQEICSRYGLEPGGLLDFSANINPLGYPPSLPKALREGLPSILHYPDINCTRLRRAITQKTRHKEKEILIGNGSTELMYLIPRAFRPQKGVIFEPTYSEYGRALRLAGANVEKLVSTGNTSFRPDLGSASGRLTSGQSQMVFLCNPNNPTGDLIKKEEILALALHQHGAGLAEGLPQSLIVVDEAFMDFVDEPHKYTVLPEAGRVKNLIVLRSMTKFFGYPGLRLGYMVAHREVISQAEGHKEPWTVNALAQLAGEAALQDEDFIFRSREYVASEKSFLYGELSRLGGINPIPPTVNFITSRITLEGLTSAGLKEMLIRKGLLIRDCSNFPGLDDKYFRVAVRRREENLLLLQALGTVLSEKTGARD
ncbi:MAG: threonine-phosphate decarboxylase [Planctomycetes bacterium]|nr:threonine-phosphate decarboxylase [Planctomycetota bacterium]